MATIHRPPPELRAITIPRLMLPKNRGSSKRRLLENSEMVTHSPGRRPLRLRQALTRTSVQCSRVEPEKAEKMRWSAPPEDMT
jgi:hypothetical protein